MDNRLEIILAARDITGAAFEGVKKQCLDLTSAVFSVNGAITTLAGGGMAYLGKASLEATAEMKKQADMAGLTARQFQELEYAGGKYRITQDALTDGIKEMNLRAEEFVATGAGPGKEAIERLGYSQAELNEKLKDTPGLLLDIIDRMQGMDRAAKMRIADEIFGGTGGEQFVAMINGGADAIRRFTREANDLGLVLDDETAAGVLKANQAVNTLTRQLEANFTRVVAQLAPDLGKMAEYTGNWVTQNQALINQNVGEVIGKVRDAAKGVKDIYDSVPDAVKGPAGFGLVGTLMLGGVGGKALFALALANEIMDKTGNGLDDLIRKRKELVELQKGLLDKIKAQFGAKDKEALQAYLEQVGLAKADVASFMYVIDESTRAGTGMSESVDKAGGSVHTLTQEAKNAAQSLRDLNVQAALDDYFKDLDSYAAGLADTSWMGMPHLDAIQAEEQALSEHWQMMIELENRMVAREKAAWEDAQADKARATEKALAKSTRAYENFSDRFQDISGEIVDNWGDTGETLVSIAKRSAAEIAQAFINQQILIPIALDVGSALGLTWQGTSFADMAKAAGNSGTGFNLPLPGFSSIKSVWNSLSNWAGWGSGVTSASGGFGATPAGIMDTGTGFGGYSFWNTGLGGMLQAAPFTLLSGFALSKIIDGFTSDDPAITFYGADKNWWEKYQDPLAMGEGGGFISAVNAPAGQMSTKYKYKLAVGDTGNDPGLQKMAFDYLDSYFETIETTMGIAMNDVLEKHKYGFATTGLDDGGSFADLSKGVFEELLPTLLVDLFPDAGTVTTMVPTLVGGEKTTVWTALGKDDTSGVPGHDLENLQETPTGKTWAGSPYSETATVPVYEDIAMVASEYADIFNQAFFASITPEGGTEWDAFIDFAETVKNTPDFLDKFNDRMNNMGLSAVDAYAQIDFVTGSLTGLEEAVAALEIDEAAAQLKTLAESFTTLMDTLESSNASLAELARAENLSLTLFYDAVVELSGPAVSGIKSMADTVKGIVFSSDQTALQKIAAQGESVITFITGLEEAVADTGNQTFIDGFAVIKDGFESVTDTLMKVQALDLYQGHLKTLGGLKASVYGMEDEWTAMQIGGKYGVALDTAEQQAAFIKSIVGLSGSEFITYSESAGVSVEELAGDMADLAGIARDTSDAFEDVVASVQDAREEFLAESGLVSPDVLLKKYLAQFNAAVAAAGSDDKKTAIQGAKDAVELTKKITKYAKEGVTDQFQMQQIWGIVSAGLNAVEEVGQEQVDLWDDGDPAEHLSELKGINIGLSDAKTAIGGLVTDTSFQGFAQGFDAVFGDGSNWDDVTSALISLPTVIAGLIPSYYDGAGNQIDPGSISPGDSIIKYDPITGTGSGVGGGGAITTYDPQAVINSLAGKYNAQVPLDNAAIAWWESADAAIRLNLASDLGVSVTELNSDFNALGEALGIPGYAAGGDHLGGYMIAGEDSWELLKTGPARVHSHRDSLEILEQAFTNAVANAFGLVLEENKQLREELKTALRLLNKSNGKMNSIIEGWEINGMPKERVLK